MSSYNEEDLIRYVQGRADDDAMTAIEIAMLSNPNVLTEVEALALLNREVQEQPGILNRPEVANAPTMTSWLRTHLPWLENPLLSLVSMSTAALLFVTLMLNPASQNANWAEPITGELSLFRVRGASDLVTTPAQPNGAILLSFDAANLIGPIQLSIVGEGASIDLNNVSIVDELALAVVASAALPPGTYTAKLNDQNGQELAYDFKVEG